MALRERDALKKLHESLKKAVKIPEKAVETELREGDVEEGELGIRVVIPPLTEARSQESR